MRLARYFGGGRVEIVEEPIPHIPQGGLLVRTEASGLCSGELMEWYMDRKVPHVLGHEVCGIVEESDSEAFPIGARVFVHHHAPCMRCDLCKRGAHVHCPTWKATKLIPGGMADIFAVGPENLSDAFVVDALGPREAALIEPLACVAKCIGRTEPVGSIAVIGLGSMGLMHLLALRGLGHTKLVGMETNPRRRQRAEALGFKTLDPAEVDEKYESVFVCPGTTEAVRFAIKTLAAPDARIGLFSPLGPPGAFDFAFDSAYFADLRLSMSYSCGPSDTRTAYGWLKAGFLKASDVVSDFVSIEDIPEAYRKVKSGDILKAMAVWE